MADDSKQKAKSQSRTVAPAKKSRALTSQKSRRSGLYGWIAIGVVLAVVAVIVGISMTGSSSKPDPTTFTKAPASVVDIVTSIPTSSFDSATATPSGAALLTTTGQATLKVANANVKVLPYVYYDGAEYCPYCAAQRWAIVATLARFGTISNLGLMTSSTVDVYPSTNTFTFWKSAYDSKYVTFDSTENFTNIPSGGSYVPLQKRSKFNTKLVNKYDYPPFVPEAQKGGWPFMDFGNQVLAPGPTFSPSYLSGLNWQQIADTLKTPSDPVAQQILVSSNLLSASICHIDGQQPASVCASKGVKAAARVIGLP